MSYDCSHGTVMFATVGKVEYKTCCLCGAILVTYDATEPVSLEGDAED